MAKRNSAWPGTVRRRERVAHLLVCGVWRTEDILRDLASRGLLGFDLTPESMKKAQTTLSVDKKHIREALPGIVVRVGEYEAAREELIQWATMIRGMAWDQKNPDAALRAALIVARAKGFDPSTALVRKLPEAPDHRSIPDGEQQFIESLPLELQREYLLHLEGRTSAGGAAPAKLAPSTEGPEEAN